jgi:two-component system, NtrC family, sensor kinase
LSPAWTQTHGSKAGRYLQEKGIQSLIDIPLALREDIYGIIRIFLTHPIALSDAEMGFIGAVSETCACAIDKARMIEEQKNQYTQLALQTEKLSALGRMAAGIAHEINNPLAGILLFSTNLLKKHPAQGQLTEGLEIIIGETQRCKGIILSLLEFSRDRAPSKIAAGINTVIEAALTILNNELRLHHIALEKDLLRRPAAAPSGHQLDAAGFCKPVDECHRGHWRRWQDTHPQCAQPQPGVRAN